MFWSALLAGIVLIVAITVAAQVFAALGMPAPWHADNAHV